MSSTLQEPEHWRQRAEEMIVLADQASDPTAKQTMLSIAAGYERLAEKAALRLAAALKKSET